MEQEKPANHSGNKLKGEEMSAIKFFIKETGEPANNDIDYFIREDGSVWRNNYRTVESSSYVVSFDDFIEECVDVDWKLED
jgi:hypothetical protein